PDGAQRLATHVRFQHHILIPIKKKKKHHILMYLNHSFKNRTGPVGSTGLTGTGASPGPVLRKNQFYI
ncbi:MAG: hypothetical protein Q8807_03890, partial ['Waltheria sp.' little leaf phytoplasma]|nr:hypothetical protein ['Waltheria sp.' little leaf phytoplasma]